MCGRYLTALGIISPFFLSPIAGAQVREKYDAFADQTTVTSFVLYDSPLFGPSKEVLLFYTFHGKVQQASTDTVAFIVKLTSVGTADISAGGWKLASRPPLYFLVDDTGRFEFPTVAADQKAGLIGRLGYSLDETVIYAIPTQDLVRILLGTQVAFKVGPWERRLKAKELQRMRDFSTRLRP
jgi:hypothetical protein